MSFFVLFVLVLILGGYILLFWSYNKGYISFKGAVISLIVSLTVYLLFPILLGKIEIQSTTLLLFLFVLCGMAIVLFIEEKINPFRKFNYSFAESIVKIKDKINHFHNAKEPSTFEASTRGKINKIKEKARNIYDTLIEKLDGVEDIKAEENTVRKDERTEKLPIISPEIAEPETQLIKNNVLELEKEEISYVDFDEKEEKHVDLFSSKNIEAEKEEAYKELQVEDQANNSAEEVQSEEIKTDSESEAELSIEQCIDKAFELKESGKIEEAIEYYIDALEKKPDDQLILWIVVDICSLYKQLGQNELARETMESYMNTYGTSLDPAMKEELLKNI